MNSYEFASFPTKTDEKLLKNHFGPNPIKLEQAQITYVDDMYKCDCMVQEIMTEEFVAYDTIQFSWGEWTQRFGRIPYDKTASGNFIRIIQLALFSGKTFIVDLLKIRDSAHALPESLMKLLNSQNVIKIVFDISVECIAYERSIINGWKEFQDSLIDLKPICQYICKQINCKQHNLRFMVDKMFGQKFKKPLQCLTDNALDKDQIDYAATDILCMIYLMKGLSVLEVKLTNEKLDSYIQKLNDENKLKETQKKLKELQDLRDIQKVLTNRRHHLETQLETIQQKRTELETKLQIAQQKEKILEAELQTSQKKENEMHIKLKTFARQEAELDAKLQTSHNKVVQLENRNQTLETKLETSQKEEDKLTDISKIYFHLLLASKNKERNTEISRKEFANRCDELETELCIAKDNTEQLQNRLRSYTKQLYVCHNKEDDMEVVQKIERRNFVAKLQQSQNKENELKTELHASQDKVKELKAELNFSQNEGKVLKAELNVSQNKEKKLQIYLAIMVGLVVFILICFAFYHVCYMDGNIHKKSCKRIEKLNVSI